MTHQQRKFLIYIPFLPPSIPLKPKKDKGVVPMYNVLSCTLLKPLEGKGFSLTNSNLPNKET